MRLHEALEQAEEAVLPTGKPYSRQHNIPVDLAIRDDWQPHRPKLTGLNIMQAVASGRKYIRRPEWAATAVITVPDGDCLHWSSGVCAFPNLHRDDYAATDWEAYD